MSLKTVIRIKHEVYDGKDNWIIKTGKLSYSFHEGLSRLFREVVTLIHDRDRITSIRIEILRKRTTRKKKI